MATRSLEMFWKTNRKQAIAMTTRIPLFTLSSEYNNNSDKSKNIRTTMRICK